MQEVNKRDVNKSRWHLRSAVSVTLEKINLVLISGGGGQHNPVRNIIMGSLQAFWKNYRNYFDNYQENGQNGGKLSSTHCFLDHDVF